MTANYFDVMKICELVTAEGQKQREEEILKSHNYTKSRYEDELKKLVLDGKKTVNINFNNSLGKGGIGDVYTCDIKKEKNLKCKYAIKLIDINNPKKENISVADQIIPLCKINHENVINVHSLKVIRRNNKYFYGIIFQYIEDIITLQDFINKYSSTLLTKEETYKIIDGLIAGMTAMHKKDLIHSDITLSNILITPNKSIVYIDPDVTELYWKQQLNNALTTISTITSGNHVFIIEKFNTDISNLMLSEDISKIGLIIKKILSISELNGSNFNTNISTIDKLKEELKILFSEVQNAR